MTEIERIFMKYAECIALNNYPPLFKAIDKYVIKARIEELETFCTNVHAIDIPEKFDERIAQLKKGLK